jgi:acyl carrier protein
MTMHTELQIFEQVRKILVELFEIDPARIQLHSRLYDEMDIDSLDAIDLILELKKLTGRKVQPEQFKHVRTVGDVVTAVRDLLQGENAA